MGVGAARVLVWLNTGIAHLLIMRGGWEVAEAVKAAPWVLFALGFGLFLSVSGMLADNEHSTQKQRSGLTVTESRGDARAGCSDMGMTAIEYAESLNRQYRRLAQRNTNSANLLDASAAPVKASCKARAETYDLVAEELDGLIALMKEERGNG